MGPTGILALVLAARAFARNPGRTLVIVTTLTLGLGLNSAIFSFVNGLLLRPLPPSTTAGSMLALAVATMILTAVGVSVRIESFGGQSVEILLETAISIGNNYKCSPGT